MTEPDLFSAAAARAARDAGIARAAANAGEFMSLGLTLIAAMPPGEYQGEDIRRFLNARGVFPHKHNAYGALIRDALRRGLIAATGRFEATKSLKTHAHKTQVYTKEDACHLDM